MEIDCIRETDGYKFDGNGSNKYLQNRRHYPPRIRLHRPISFTTMISLSNSKNNEQHQDSLLNDQSDYDQFFHQFDESLSYELRQIPIDSDEESPSQTDRQNYYRVESNTRFSQSHKQVTPKMSMHESSHVPKLKKSKREHLKMKRNRGPKNLLQKKVNGYWTKNFLQFGKKAHFLFLENRTFTITQQEQKVLNLIKKKSGISMEEYETMYKMEGLEDIWLQFFATKYLYRSLMISRVEKAYRLIFVKFIHVYEKSFRNKKFQGINRTW